jgi:hypothetical protein
MPSHSTGAPAVLNAVIATTQSHVLDLNGITGVSVHVVTSDVNPAAVTFDSLTKASKVIQDITYTAKTGGTAGNSITVTYTTGGTAGSEVVTVVANAISVQIESGVSTATQVNTAVGLSAPAMLLIDKAVTGTGSTAQVAAVAAALAGGLASNIDLSSDAITIASHGYITGTKAALTTAGTLPTGVTATNYWIIKIDDNTVKLASSLANAVAGTKVNITVDGSGTHTLTPAAAGSNTFKLQKSNVNDTTSWIDITDMSVTIATSATNTMFEVALPKYRYMRLIYTASAGQINLATTLTVTQ